MEKETKKTQNSFMAKRRWVSPVVDVVSLNESNDVLLLSQNSNDVIVDDWDWGLPVE